VGSAVSRSLDRWQRGCGWHVDHYTDDEFRQKTARVRGNVHEGRLFIIKKHKKKKEHRYTGSNGVANAVSENNYIYRRDMFERRNGAGRAGWLSVGRPT